MKNILVVGGSSGIGRSLCNKLAEAGHAVYATYRNHPVEDDRIRFAFLDVTAKELDLSFLPDSLHGVVYCPGSISLRPFSRISSADFASDYELQVGGAVRVLQGVLARLKAGSNASVVLFSSVAAKTGMPFHTQVAATKSAIEGLSRALAAELAPGVRVNCIAPSLTDTPLAAALLSSPEKREANAQRHPMKRVGSADDIAAMAMFLLSDESGWMTGQVLHVDGGMSTIR
jgi:NAD(P)-dependent dehydrogenase (short-subunit alcohol dehydrogenase family)